MVIDVKKEGRLGSSDHEILLCTIEVDIKKVKGGSQRKDWRRADFDGMRSDLVFNWDVLLEGKNINEVWRVIKGKIVTAMDIHIPWKRVEGRARPKWLSRKILNLIGKKKKLWKKFKETGLDRDKKVYKKSEKEVKKSIENAKKNYEKKVAREGKKQPKQFYAYLKGEKGNRVRVGPLKTENGDLVIDPKEQADLLNLNYASVFTVPDSEVLEELECLVNDGHKLRDVQYTEEKVIKCIDHMRKKAAGGLDGIPPRVLKEIKTEIARP